MTPKSKPTKAASTKAKAPPKPKVQPFLSMVMIARDEKANIARCFDSWWEHVDQVVLVDTGSTDGTLAAARAYAKRRKETRKLITAQFEWVDDFAAARNFADSLSTATWRAWCDLDDTVVGMDQLRAMCEQADPAIAGFYAQYDYVVDAHGVVQCELVRERVVRGAMPPSWHHPIHEAQLLAGTAVQVDPAAVRWIHHATGNQDKRNLRILKAWQKREPEDPRLLQYLGLEYGAAGDATSAIEQYELYLQAPGQPPEQRAQAARRLSGCYLLQGKLDEAYAVASGALAENPDSAETYLALAEVSSEKHDWQRAISFASEVVRRGKPQSSLIVNPVDYTAKPRLLMAQALAAIGQLDEAIAAAEQALEIAPGYPAGAELLGKWKGRRHRDGAAATWANSAQMLCGFDEPLKAAELLETVPFYCAHHPAIVKARVDVARALQEPYKVVKVPASSGRGQFLIKQLAEQSEDPDGGKPFTLRVYDPAGATEACLQALQASSRVEIDHVPGDDADSLYDAVIVTADLDMQFDPGERFAVLLQHVAPGGRVYVVCPEGRIGEKRTPGRRRAWASIDLASMLRAHGRLEAFGVDDDGYICASMTPTQRLEEISIWTGYAIGPWHPEDIFKQGLGGSETAAWRIAEELDAIGYVVTLYGHFAQEGTVKGVILRDWQSFDPTLHQHAVIAFRDSQMFDHEVNAHTKLLWLEDTAGAEGLTPERAERIDRICTVSKWHRGNVLEHYPWLDPEKVHAHRNGVYLPYFSRGTKPEREKRVLYTSSPDRGLDVLLEIWPEVLEQVPDAELHHAYSRWYDLVADHTPGISTHRQRLRALEEAAGSHRLPAQGQGDLAHLMRSSLVWCAPSYFSPAKLKFDETSCISAMEAQAAGLVVVASKWGALAETVKVGKKIAGDPMGKAWRRKFVDAIVAGLTVEEVQREAQSFGPAAMADMGWRGVAEALQLEWGHRPGTIRVTSTL